MAEASKEDTEVRNIINVGEDKDGGENNNEETDDEGGSSVRDVLEKLSDFLTKNNLEKQITDERKKILRKIEGKNEEISQKNETHRHKLCEIHEAYKIEIQKENERHVEDLKVTETAIRQLKSKLEDLQQLNYSISRKIPSTELPSSSNSGRLVIREMMNIFLYRNIFSSVKYFLDPSRLVSASCLNVLCAWRR